MGEDEGRPFYVVNAQLAMNAPTSFTLLDDVTATKKVMFKEQWDTEHVASGSKSDLVNTDSGPIAM